MAETTKLLSALQPLCQNKNMFTDVVSEDSIMPASEEGNTPNSEEAGAPNSEEVLDNSASDAIDMQENNDDVVSLIGGNDFDNIDSNNDEFLEAIDVLLRPSDARAPAIYPKITQITNEKFSSHIGLEERRNIIEKSSPPQNCDKVIVPKVSDNFHRQRYLRTGVLQDSIVRVASSLSVTVDHLLKFREMKSLPDFRAITTRLFYAVTLLGHANLELSYKR